MINSKIKGKVGELELSKFLRDRGFTEARRGQQFKGTADSPDVVGIPGFHIECKRVERGSVTEWFAQAVRDANGQEKPVVCHRKNRHEWMATLKLEDFLDLVKRAQ